MATPAIRTPVLVLLGPTASGKTEYALELAERFNGEVISQDSRQVYRYMDLGTAKPTSAQRARAPHHGLDLVSPDEPWTLAQQQALTYEAVAGASGRGSLPMLVGGTGQYLRAVLEGWTIPAVPPDVELRARLAGEAGTAGSEALWERLRLVDPEAATRIMRTDVRRVVRALEVWELTGRKLSEQQQAQPPPYDFLIIGLTMPREALYARTNERADRMLDSGLLEEIEMLLSRGYDRSLSSMRTIGYGEFQPLFEGRASKESCVDRLRFNTHKFVRHQYVWFRRFESVIWLDPRQSVNLKAGTRAVGDWLRGHAGLTGLHAL